MSLLNNRDASDLIKRRDARMLYANKIIKEQALSQGLTNRIDLNSDKSSSSLLPMNIGAFFTSPEEQAIILQVNSALPAPPITDLISSKNNTTDEGFTVGGSVNKDMENIEYTNEFDPNNYQSDFFPGMADFVDSNILEGDKDPNDRLIASEWNDLGNDVFDDWGFFYLYDVNSGKYYFPLINPQNEDDGILTTQTFNTFGRTFTIHHGWTVQGIFKFDVSVNDNLPFRFGAYGNMGSDGDENIENLTYSYNINERNLTLYYQRHAEDGDNNEILYSYWIPKKTSDNISITYDFYNDGDDNSMMSTQITNGVIVYFSKTNDVKEWVANDLQIV